MIMTKFEVFRTFAACSIAVLIGNVSPVHAQSSGRAIQTAEAYAQPTDHDNLATMANAVNAQRSAMFAKGDAAGIASLYTQNATYIELLPRLIMMGGRARIEEHFRDLFKAHATELKSSVTSASRIDGDNALVGGDYYIVAKNRKTMGHFVQILRQESGTWKIISHVFARPDPITFEENNEYKG
jgi:uncharacterized protein (TIGR02246 family)